MAEVFGFFVVQQSYFFKLKRGNRDEYHNKPITAAPLHP